MNDKVFGELVFNNGWEKELKCNFGNQKIVKIRISSYENEEPNNKQREAYVHFVEDTEQISKISYKKLEDYIKIISEDIIAYLELKELPMDINEIVSVNHILFMESGNFAIMCDAKWDDHGVAVLFTEKDVIAGPQDIVWMNE